jgi:hypothetical protein
MAFYMIVDDFEEGNGPGIITDIRQAPDEVIIDGVVGGDKEATAEYLRRMNESESGQKD